MCAFQIEHFFWPWPIGHYRWKRVPFGTECDSEWEGYSIKGSLNKSTHISLISKCAASLNLKRQSAGPFFLQVGFAWGHFGVLLLWFRCYGWSLSGESSLGLLTISRQATDTFQTVFVFSSHRQSMFLVLTVSDNLFCVFLCVLFCSCSTVGARKTPGERTCQAALLFTLDKIQFMLTLLMLVLYECCMLYVIVWCISVVCCCMSVVLCMYECCMWKRLHPLVMLSCSWKRNSIQKYKLQLYYLKKWFYLSVIYLSVLLIQWVPPKWHPIQ